MAMQMASRSGDMRRLLDACTAAVDLLVQDAIEQQSEHAKGEICIIRLNQLRQCTMPPWLQGSI